LIARCASWHEFQDLVNQQSKTKDKGDLFERMTQLYLQTSPTYATKLKNVWWCNNGELPDNVRKKLHLPFEDEGIDLICETYDGKYWSVQSKYRADSERPLTTKELSKFVSLSFVTGDNIIAGLVVHTSTKKVQKSKLMGNTFEIGLQHWLSITNVQWKQILEVCETNVLKQPQPRLKRDHQQIAIDKVNEHFGKHKASRGKLIMPCGTGKSLIAYWATRELQAESVIVAVPSLALVKQSLEDWTSEYLADGIQPDWIAVCSDDSVGTMKESDSTVATVYEAGIPTTTDPVEIANFIIKKTKKPKVIFTTYQSSPKLAAACKEADLTIDLLIADEAHKTVGRKDKKFATLLSDENIKIQQRLFMTATERVYRQGTDHVASMDDISVYGEIFHQMSFKKAIEDGIICDYKILTVSVAEQEVSNLMSEQAEIMAQLGNQKVETDAHSLAAGIAIEKIFQKHNIKHALSFHRSIKRSENFTKQQEAFSGKFGNKFQIKNRNISSRLTAGQRSQVLDDFSKDKFSLITNARCLTEGVDIPSIDCVTFVDPKQSTVDIVQAAGRAMRQSKETGKTHGYIVLPIIVPDGQNLSEFAETTDFAAVARVITSLSTQDERIVEQLRGRKPGQPPKPDDVIIIDPDIVKALDVNYGSFHDAVNTKIWANVGRANWRPFEEAREFVRKLELKNVRQWNKYAESDLKPPDIPHSPNTVYSQTEWLGYGDWLGTGNISNRQREFLPFQEAREYARSLNLYSQKEWEGFTGTKNRPQNIPSNPASFYAESGWISMGDWLGTGTIAPQNRKFRSFAEARKFVRSLNLKTQNDWENYCKSGDLPIDMPVALQNVYKDSGWNGFPDFLGIHYTYVYRTFDEARSFARSLELKTQADWWDFCKSEKMPTDIPRNPNEHYKDKGWIGYIDWLGNEDRNYKRKSFIPFIEARAFVRELGLKAKASEKITTVATWENYVRGNLSETFGTRPHNIPANPPNRYKNEGWDGWQDWLGTGPSISHRKPRSFIKAREFVRSLRLDLKVGQSLEVWREWAKSSERPADIPRDPANTYKDKGWAGIVDWIGKDTAKPIRDWKNFNEARSFVRKQKLKNWKEWQVWLASDNRPLDIPSRPATVYRDVGWNGSKDWLGS